MFRGKTEASKGRQSLTEARGRFRDRPDLTVVPDTPMEIASDMARIILEMRHAHQNTGLKQRLELLAEHFLHLTDCKDGESARVVSVGRHTAEAPVANIH